MSTLIPRNLLYGNPDREQVQISPDGRYISYLGPVGRVLNVWVAPVSDPSAGKPVTNDTVRGIRFHGWTHLPDHLLYVQDTGGDENWHVYDVDVVTGIVKDLTPIQGVNAQVNAISAKHPDSIIVGLNNRMPQLHDLYLLDLKTGKRKLLVENPGFASFEIDSDFVVRLAFQMQPDGGMQILQQVDGKWQPWQSIPQSDTLTTHPVGYDVTGKTLYLADGRNRDTAALFALDTETEKTTLLAEDSRADLGDTLRHPITRKAQAVAFTYERKIWHVIDPDIAADLDYLKTVTDGEIAINARTNDDAQWIVAYLMDNSPVRYYLYDRAAHIAKFLFTNRSALEKYALSKMHSIVIPARDGLKLVSYLTLPPGSDSKKPGVPDRPVPLVLFVHGGPWGRDTWGFSPFHQHLANRGYAVLSPNFRGSTGFGKAFSNAGDLEWGQKMHDDLIDSVEWAIREGITTRDRVAIMGGSYGGYATLVGMTMTPDVFCCGVDIVGPSNLFTLIESIPPYWEPMVAMFRTRMGDNTTEEGRALLKARSPLTYVDKIRHPLLIAQGANDPRVKQAESDQIVSAMQIKGIPVTYALYPDEGHGFGREQNWLSFTAITEAFLASQLEGEVEPIGHDFENSSIKFLTGIEAVPGAAELLNVTAK